MRKQIVLDANTKIVRLGGRPPTVVLVLLIVECAAFLIYAFADGPKWVAAHLAASAATCLAQLQVYQPFSALWVHLDTTTLLFNMLTLWLFGSALERWWGGRRFLFFWLVTGVVGLAAGVLVGQVLSPTSVVFGSGGVTAAMLLASVLIWPRHMPFIYKGVLPLKARWLALIVGGFLLISNATSGAWLMIAVELGGAAVALLFLGSIRRLWGEAQVKRAKKKFKVIEGGKPGSKRYMN